jgi:hypothetical protein
MRKILDELVLIGLLDGQVEVPGSQESRIALLVPLGGRHGHEEKSQDKKEE